MTRSQLIALLNASVLTGGSRTTAQLVRDYENEAIASNVNKTDDANANDGYMAIDSNGRVDITKITDPTPIGKFLKDDGTWGVVGIRTTTIATATTVTPNVTTTDQHNTTALASAITYAAPIGVPVDGQALILTTRDNGTPRAITYSPVYKFNIGISAPTTTVINITLIAFFKWNLSLSAWQCFYTTQSTGGGIPALTATQIGFGDGSNLLSGSSDFIYDSGHLIITRSTIGYSAVFVNNSINLGGFAPLLANDGFCLYGFGYDTSSNIKFFADASGLHINSNAAPSGKRIYLEASDMIVMSGAPLVYANQYSNSATPSIAAGAGAGTGATVSVVGTNKTGKITITAGTTPTVGGDICTLTFSGGFAFPTGCVCQLSNADDTTLQASLSSLVFATGGTTTVVITAASIFTLGAGTFKLNYIIEGY